MCFPVEGGVLLNEGFVVNRLCALLHTAPLSGRVGLYISILTVLRSKKSFLTLHTKDPLHLINISQNKIGEILD